MAVLFSDNFNRADGDVIDGTIYQSVGAEPHPAISSNRLSSNTSDAVLELVPYSDSNPYVEFKPLSALGASIGYMVVFLPTLGDWNNRYALEFTADAGLPKIKKTVATVFTDLVTSLGSITGVTTVRFQIIGNLLFAYYDGKLVGIIYDTALSGPYFLGFNIFDAGSSVFADDLVFGSVDSVTDNFKRADGSLGSNWTTNSEFGGTAPVIANQLVVSGGDYGSAIYNVATYTNCEVTVDYAQVLNINDDATRIYVRVSGTNPYSAGVTGYMVTINHAVTGDAASIVTTTLIKFSNGAGDFANMSFYDKKREFQFLNGYQLKVRIIGNKIELYVGILGSFDKVATWYDGTYSSAGYTGFNTSDDGYAIPMKVNTFNVASISAPTVAVAGNITASITESNIVSGSKVLTLTASGEDFIQ